MRAFVRFARPHFNLLPALLSLTALAACSPTSPGGAGGNGVGTGGTGGMAGSAGAAGSGGSAAGSGGMGTGGMGTGGSGAGAGGGAGVGGNAGGAGSSGGSAGASGGAGGATGGAGGIAGTAGVGGDPDPGPESGGGDGCTDDSEVHDGTFTYYTLDAEAAGTCSLNQGEPPYWAAMNEGRFGESGEDCGACIEIDHQGQTAIVQVVDKCPADAANIPCQSTEHIDLSQAAFAALGINGKGSGTWKYIPCDVAGNIEIFTKGDTTEWWASISIRHHRYRLDKVEYRKNGALLPLFRQPHNMWNTSEDETVPKLGLGPVRIRITDIYGHWIENLVSLTPDGTTDMELQFPACSG